MQILIYVSKYLLTLRSYQSNIGNGNILKKIFKKIQILQKLNLSTIKNFY